MRILTTTIALLLTIPAISGRASAQQVERGDRAILDVVGVLKPGQYVWAPELGSDGPSLVVVNLETQRLRPVPQWRSSGGLDDIERQDRP